MDFEGTRALDLYMKVNNQLFMFYILKSQKK